MYLEVLHPSLLPAGLQRCGPVRLGRAVGPHVDRRRRALKNEQLPHRLGQSRNALNGRRARADAPKRDAAVGDGLGAFRVGPGERGVYDAWLELLDPDAAGGVVIAGGGVSPRIPCFALE